MTEPEKITPVPPELKPVLEYVLAKKVCRVCKRGHQTDNIILCDGCDHAYHIFCLDPPLDAVPEGDWWCKVCQPKKIKIKYFVVPLEKQKTKIKNRSKYVCVPNNWVIGLVGNSILFRYPDEKISVTKKRIEEGEKVSTTWSVYFKTVLYRKQSFQEAQQCVKIMEAIGHETQADSEASDQSECNEQQNQGNSNGKSKKRRTIAEDSTDEDNNSTDSTSTKNTLNHSVPVTSDQSKCNKRPNQGNRNGKSKKRRASVEDSTDEDDNSSNSTSTKNSLNANEVQKICANIQNLVKEMKQQNDCFEKLKTEFKEIRNVSLANAATLEKMQSDKLNTENNCEDNNTAEDDEQARNKAAESVKKTSKLNTDNCEDNNTAENDEQVRYKATESVKNTSKLNTENNCEDNNTVEDDEQARKKAAESVKMTSNSGEENQAQVTPKNNSQWTLRYHKMAPGLEELVEGTGVFVNSEKFANAMEAKYGLDLARMLLVEIFSDEALATCSLTGTRPAGWSRLGEKPIKPGLDEHAKNVLLDFVEDNCKKKLGYRRELEKCLTNKLYQIQKKHMVQETLEEDKVTPQQESIWTLRYREMAPGLEELVEGTGVYVVSHRLANCKEMASCGWTLADMLLVEIFSDEALATCFLNRRRAYRARMPDSPVAPNLDHHAMEVLLDFVEYYAKQKKWCGSRRRRLIEASLAEKLARIQNRPIENTMSYIC